MVAGVVIDRGRGNVILKTDRGLLQLATNLALKLGSEVLLEVQSVGAQMRFTVVSVDHRPASLVGADVASPSQDLMPDGLVVPDDGPALLTGANSRSTIIGRLLTAELVTASGLNHPSLNIDSIPSLLRRITTLTATLGSAASTDASDTSTGVAVRLPVIPNVEALERILAAVGTLAPDVVEALLGEATVPESALPTADATSTTGTALRPDPTNAKTIDSGPQADTGSTPPKLIAIRPLEVLNPPAGGLGPSGLLHPQATDSDSITLFGTVVRSDAHITELSTPLGTLRLSNAVGLSEGTVIAFEIVTEAVPGGAIPVSSPTTAIPQRTLTAEPPHDWAALRDVASALAQNPAINTDTIVPKAGAMLGPALLALFTNLKCGGNAKTWLGKTNVDGLDAAVRDRLLDRLDGELAAQARAANAPDRDGWQTTAVPIADGQRMAEIRIHTQNRRKNSGGNDETNSRRFVIETTLTALGPLQLDGLVRPHRFDLIVRTTLALPDEMRRDIETLFSQSLSGTDHNGGVSFRSDAAAWINAGKDSLSQRSGVIA
jgi:hypothetical protein